MTRHRWSDEIPIKFGPASNGEILVPPTTAVQREAQRRILAEADVLAHRLGTTRRQFLNTICGSALSLTVLAACSKEEQAARSATSTTTTSEPGGTFTLPPSSTTEPEAAAEVLSGPEPVIDVQTHVLDFDLSSAEPSFFFGSSFPQVECGLDDARECFMAERFLEDIFIRSDTSAIVLSALPAYGAANPLTLEHMVATRSLVTALCGDERVYVQGQGAPHVGDPAAALAAMDVVMADHPDLVAWKVYTHNPDGFFLDDHDPDRPPLGTDFIRRAVDGGVPVVAVHKGLSGNHPAASPVDIGPAAVRHPDCSFLVYHSGLEGNVSEGAFDLANPNGGVDRLIASLRDAGVGPGSNVYAELGSTWRILMSRPNQAAHVLGKLLVACGPDNILWGTDSIWYGSPQDQIEALRAFEITEEFQETYGYPALTAEVKEKILGGNAVRLHGIDLGGIPCEFTREELRAVRESMPISHVTRGPTERDDIVMHLAAHGAW
ncbi:MAG: amidohydrolase family protein [Acidimicrobiales bacterium]|nr:amidohydrolase family protein [Acidimicrobiales bacterium]